MAETVLVIKGRILMLKPIHVIKLYRYKYTHIQTATDRVSLNFRKTRGSCYYQHPCDAAMSFCITFPVPIRETNE